MWTAEHELELLNRLKSGAAVSPVLSLYLPLDRTPAIQKGYVALAKDILKSVEPVDAAAFEDASAAVVSYLQDEFTPGGRTLALFRAAGDRTPEILRLQISLPGIARFDQVPYLAPLEAASENYPAVAVVVVDERTAKVFTTALGELDHDSTLRHDIPRRQRQGGWAAANIESNRAEQVRDHFRAVADHLQQLDQVSAFKRLIIGAAAESTSALTEALSPQLRAKVVGTFTPDISGPEQAVLDAAFEIAVEAERAEEVELVKEIRDRAMAGGKASLGWDETLQVLGEGRGHRLAIGEKHLGTEEGDRALQLAWQTNAQIEFVGGEAEELLADNGGIGALLRY